MLVALVAALLAVQPPRPFVEERELLDRRKEALRRVLPDGATPAADLASAREMAEAARLARVEVQARPPHESGARGEVVLDVTALGGYEEIDRFFRRVSLSPRLVDVESLTLTAAGDDVIRLATVLRFPYWPLHAALPPPPESPNGRPAGTPKPVLEAFLRDRALVFAKSEAVAARRRTRRTPRLFLAELAAACRERPVAIGFASLGDDFTIRGTALGEAPLRAFEGRLERGFFQVTDFLIAKQGACHRFDVHGRSPVAGPDAELPVPVEDPFEQAGAPCRVDRDGSRSLVVRGRAPTPKAPGNGPLTLRLRDVDLADVFQTLARLGFGGYVVDGAVAGRTSVELVRATLDEALAVLRKATGVELGEVGPLRRVSTAPLPKKREVAAGGALASFALKRAEVRDLLAASAEVDPALAALGPPGFLGRVSVFTRDVPLQAVRAAVLDAAELRESSDESRRLLQRATGASEAPVPVARSGPEPRLVLRREELSLDEFALAGVGSGNAGFVAFAYAPTGQLHAYAPGDRLADAVVRAIDADGVTLDTEEGPLHVALPPMPN